MNRVGDLRGRLTGSGRRAAEAIRGAYSPSALFFAAVIVLDIALLFMAMAIGQYLGKSPVTSLTQAPADAFACTPDTEGIGNHCFGDYAVVQKLSLFADPWARHMGVSFNYTAGAILPSLPFTAIGALFGSVRLGLFLYLAALLVALAVPAWWASRNKPLSIRIVVIAAFGFLSVPALMVLDRGNSIGFLAPVLLAYFVGLARGNDRTVVIALVLATLIKPQFIILGIILIAGRRWKLGFIALGSVIAANIAAYLFWPTHFPATIIQSIKNLFMYGGGVSLFEQFPPNVSYASGLHQLELALRQFLGRGTSSTWADGNENLIGAVMMLLVAAWVVVLGKRMPLHIGGMLLVISASMLSGLTWSYYLVFVLPIAAMLLRNPVDVRPETGRWRGIVDDHTRITSFHGFAAIMLVIAAALTTSRVMFATPAIAPPWAGDGIVRTATEILPVFWAIASIAILLAWTVRRAPVTTDSSVRAEA